MNIFAVDVDPDRAARSLCDRHVVRMVLESAQMLSTVARQRGLVAPYRPTHQNHPCVLWVGARYANWVWLVDHGLALSDEFTRRYGKRHKSEEVIRWAVTHRSGPRRSAQRRLPFAQAMPEQYRGRNAVEAYRRYYVAEKSHFCTWKEPAHPPRWWPALTR